MSLEQLDSRSASDRVSKLPGARRLAVVVSHPIQYYVPLYQRLAARDDLQLRVFFTWHGGEAEVWDAGFKQPIRWDLPLTAGYDHQLVRNTARDPGTHHFWGLRNPDLLKQVTAWQPDAVHLTGYAWASHLQLLRQLSRRGVPVLFRGDSHLLDAVPRWKRLLKQAILSQVFRWPAGFLCVGRNNRDYYRHFGVPESKLFDCPHVVDVERFAEPNDRFEAEASAWRDLLGIGDGQPVLLFAGKFEEKKRPLELMRAILAMEDGPILLLVGDGGLSQSVRDLAQSHPMRFRVLPFQNQSRMPVVYRLGDLLVLPSAHSETWSLAVNEAFACGRPALVSDKVGCAADIVLPGVTGDVFAADDWGEFQRKAQGLLNDPARCRQMGVEAQRQSARYTLSACERPLLSALAAVVSTPSPAGTSR